jgi:plasmid stabilization system protein ParE
MRAEVDRGAGYAYSRRRTRLVRNMGLHRGRQRNSSQGVEIIRVLHGARNLDFIDFDSDM